MRQRRTAPRIPRGGRRPRAIPLLPVCGLAFLLAAGPVRAADDAGIPGSYLRYGSSARSLGLGNAVAGLADDVATAYWNPAGLSQLRTMELTGMEAILFEDTRYTFFALGLPTEHWGTFALSGSLVSSGEFERATIFEDLDESFSEREGAFCLSFARGSGRFAWGLNLKSVSQNVGGSKGSGTGVDVGVYLRPHRNLSLGAAVQNLVAPEITLEEDAEKLVRSVRGGLALRFFNNRLLALADLVKTEYMDASFHTGLEVWPTRAIGVRGGYDTGKEQFSAGLGVRWENWQLDYAFIDHELGASNVVSATFRFGVPYGVKMHRDRELFSPSGAERSVNFTIDTAVRGHVESWQLLIRDGDGNVVRRLQGNGEPPEGIAWNGDDDQGRLVADGDYAAQVIILDDLGQEWDYETSVEVLGFRDRTRVPIRVEINGGSDNSTEGDQR